MMFSYHDYMNGSGGMPAPAPDVEVPGKRYGVRLTRTTEDGGTLTLTDTNTDGGGYRTRTEAAARLGDLRGKQKQYTAGEVVPYEVDLRP